MPGRQASCVDAVAVWEFVEIPPIFVRLHNQATWGAAVYNLAAIGACWIFAEFLASSADQGRTGCARNVAKSHPDPLVA